MAEVAWKRSEVGVPVRYCKRHFLPLSPLLRGIVTGASDLQAVLLQQTEIANRDTSQECLPGAGAEFTGGAEELSSPAPALGKCVCPKTKAFWEGHLCIFCGVSGDCGESQPVGAVGRGQGEL